jgi:alkanesulfonate monooxygenase
MGIKILWYLTLPDGPVPWEPEGRWEGGFEHLQQLAGAIDKLGYYGALLATGFGGNEVLTVASSVIGVTRRMKFLAAIHPGLLSPAKLAQIALTIDNFSGGRLLFNAVNGNDATLPAFGVHYQHDERYDFSLEYWQAFQASYLGQEHGYDGKYIKLAPRPAMAGGSRKGVAGGGGLKQVQSGGVPLWGAGTSPAGVAHSIRLLDVYLSFANAPPLLGDKFRRVGAEAAKIGRSLKFGTRLQVIVRETEEEAWAYAQWLIDRTSVEYAVQSIKRQLPKGETLESYRSSDPQVQKNVEVIRSGRLPKAKDFEVYPNVWVGPALHARRLRRERCRAHSRVRVRRYRRIHSVRLAPHRRSASLRRSRVPTARSRARV